MKSIKTRLMISYIAVIFLAVFILESFLIISIRKYYYDNIQEAITRQAEVSGKFFEKYMQSKDIKTDANNLIEAFTGSTNAQVQIINTEFKLLADSLGISDIVDVNSPDVKSALSGGTGVWKGKLKASGESVMSVSYPLKKDNSILGVVRLVTSLEDVNKVIAKAILIIVLIGLVVIALVAFISIIISSTIINPVKNITKAAESMSHGNFKVRLSKQYDDEIGKLSDTLNYMADQITKNENLKNEFIASVSHEIRTPLTSINGWAITLLRNDIKDKNQIEYGLKIIEKESERLASLVGELLDFSKLSSGKITLRKECIDINELINYVKAQTFPRAQRQGINFISELDRKIGLIYADPDRLKQVLLNIIDNSFKFTPSGGGITITSSTLNDKLKISIRDTGCGIDTESLEKVKQRFYKVNPKSSGSGLGLAICDEIINLHNGKLIIDSVPGKGTIVDILLPL